MRKVFNLLIGFVFFSAGILSAQDTLKFENLHEMKNACYGFGTATNGKSIFTVGGDSYSFRDMLNTIDRYDIVNNHWDRIGAGIIPRRYLNAEYVPSLNKIYIFNGECSYILHMRNNLYASRRSKVRLTDVIEIVDLNTNTVSAEDNNPYPVIGAGSAVWNNKIYVFGGWNPMGYSDKLYVFDPVKNEWTRLADMPEAKKTKGTIIDGILFTFGGFDNDAANYKTIHAYNIAGNKWSLVGELPHGISANAIAFDGRNIWLVGAYNDLNFLAAFDTKTKTVKTFKSNMTGRRHAGAQVINNRLYVFGGNQTTDNRTALAGLQCADISKYIDKN